MKKYKNDVIIIGSGIGGLSCAAFLAKEGYQVKIFEKSDPIIKSFFGFIQIFVLII
jgi:phytoene dehydrogenase-like protein